MEDRPVAAFVLSLIGGILMLSTGLLMLMITDIIAPSLYEHPDVHGHNRYIVRVRGHHWWMHGIYQSSASFSLGGLIVAFSVMSFFSTGGLIIGIILGILGGILGIAWKPRSGVAATPTMGAYHWQPPTTKDNQPKHMPAESAPFPTEKSCHKCGSINVYEAIFCRSCGARIK